MLGVSSVMGGFNWVFFYNKGGLISRSCLCVLYEAFFCQCKLCFWVIMEEVILVSVGIESVPRSG